MRDVGALPRAPGRAALAPLLPRPLRLRHLLAGRRRRFRPRADRPVLGAARPRIHARADVRGKVRGAVRSADGGTVCRGAARRHHARDRAADVDRGVRHRARQPLALPRRHGLPRPDAAAPQAGGRLRREASGARAVRRALHRDVPHRDHAARRADLERPLEVRCAAVRAAGVLDLQRGRVELRRPRRGGGERPADDLRAARVRPRRHRRHPERDHRRAGAGLATRAGAAGAERPPRARRRRSCSWRRRRGFSGSTACFSVIAMSTSSGWRRWRRRRSSPPASSPSAATPRSTGASIASCSARSASRGGGFAGRPMARRHSTRSAISRRPRCAAARSTRA